MYRSRLEGKLDENTLEFLSSISDDFQIALYDILGSQAHTLMLLENNILRFFRIFASVYLIVYGLCHEMI